MTIPASDSMYARGYPLNQPTARLTQLIAAVCPVSRVSIGRWDNRDSWEFKVKPEATAAQMAAARRTGQRSAAAP